MIAPRPFPMVITTHAVIPAKAGIPFGFLCAVPSPSGAPAFAGVTEYIWINFHPTPQLGP